MPTGTDLTVVEWNLHWGCERVAGRYPYERFDELEPLAAWLGDADVVVLPEAWRDHGGVGVVDRLGAQGWHTSEVAFVTLDLSGRPDVAHPGTGTWSLALATRAPHRVVREIPLPVTKGDPVPRRHALHVEVEHDGGPFDLVAFHVSSKLWFGAPPIQLRGLARAARDLGRERPALLVGDANWWRTTLPLWLPGWRGTVRGATFPAPRPHSQIDHVLVRGGLESVAAEVGPAARSDHRLVRVRLRRAR